MIEPNKRYTSPFTTRYSSDEMSYIWSDHNRYVTWRYLWCVLAQSLMESGVENISEEQISEMLDNVGNIDMESVVKHEMETKHDVVAHMRAFCDVAPSCSDIIHMGATSQYIVDNADSIMVRDSCLLLINKIAKIASGMGEMAYRYRSLEMVGLTHLQEAQPVTYGKRVCMWIQDLVIAMERIGFDLDKMMVRGVKGTTGTMCSFKDIVGEKNLKKFSMSVVEKMGFKPSSTDIITGQTYPRQFDASLASSVCLIGSACGKMASDIRLLSSRGEINEGFQTGQVGSSAMPYKKNPISCEKVCSLSRYLISLLDNFYHTAQNQWFERSLDDSANRRLSIPEMFLCADEILESIAKVVNGIHVNETKILENVKDSRDKFISERFLSECVSKNGADRNVVHEYIKRCHIQSGIDGRDFMVLLSDPSWIADTSGLDSRGILYNKTKKGESIKRLNKRTYEGMKIHLNGVDPKNIETEGMSGMCCQQVERYLNTTISALKNHYT